MGKTIFIGSRKGGVGKTMTAANLSHRSWKSNCRFCVQSVLASYQGILSVPVKRYRYTLLQVPLAVAVIHRSIFAYQDKVTAT